MWVLVYEDYQWGRGTMSIFQPGDVVWADQDMSALVEIRSIDRFPDGDDDKEDQGSRCVCVQVLQPYGEHPVGRYIYLYERNLVRPIEKYVVLRGGGGGRYA